MADPCGKSVYWWDGEYEGECERPVGHWGFHFDGLSWFDDDGVAHDQYCTCWCHIEQPDWMGGPILKSCGCSPELFKAVADFYQMDVESLTIPQKGPGNE